MVLTLFWDCFVTFTLGGRGGPLACVRAFMAVVVKQLASHTLPPSKVCLSFSSDVRWGLELSTSLGSGLLEQGPLMSVCCPQTAALVQTPTSNHVLVL